MGGARPKAVVEDDDSLWLAKFSAPHDRWSHPRIEHAFLRLAHACGLNVADSKLVTVGGKDVLMVRRFDRDKSEHGYRRHRMVSALTLLKSEDIPAAKKDWSYLLLADEIRTHFSDRTRLLSMAVNARRLAKPESTSVLVTACKEALDA